MATLAALKKKIADLEAQVEKVAKAEMGSAIAKVRKIMADYGLTVEHLLDGPTAGKAPKKRASAKQAKKPKGSRPPKYRDPATGMTWTGVGRAPAWIANAKSRDEFLIAAPAAAAVKDPTAAPAKRAAKRSKAATAAKKGARKTVGAVKRVAKAAGAKPPAKKVAVKKAASKKIAAKKFVGKKAASKVPRKPRAAVPTATGPASTETAAA